MGWRYRFYAVRIWRKVSLVSKHFLEILILLDVAIMVSIFQTNPWLLQMLKSHLKVDMSKDLICPKSSSSSPPASQQVATLSFQLLNWKILESLPWPLSLSVCLSVCLSLSLTHTHTHTHTQTPYVQLTSTSCWLMFQVPWHSQHFHQLPPWDQLVSLHSHPRVYSLNSGQNDPLNTWVRSCYLSIRKLSQGFSCHWE